MSLFKKAVKHEAKLRLALAGPSGSGKTYTALAVATNLANGGRVALVDTEHGSASKYADIFDFDVAEMSAPFHPSKYSKAIAEAAAAGYDVIILDSLSHAWNGPGGVLEIVEQASKRFKGNSYAGWQEGTPVHNSLIEAIVSAPIHIIGTMRSKTDYILVDRNGKQTPQKVGMAPVQRDGFEYEFDVFIDMDIENNGIVGKTRCSALAGKVIERPGADLAKILGDWLGGPEAPEPKAEPTPKAEPEMVEFDDLKPAVETPANGSAPDPLKAARDSLTGRTSTLGDIATAAVMTKLYDNTPHAFNAVKLYDWPEHPDFKLESEQKVKTATALQVLDWLIGRKLDEADAQEA